MTPVCSHHPESNPGYALPCSMCAIEAWKKKMTEEPIYVGLPQAAKTFYHKASNGNVSIMRLATPYNWAEFCLKCNKCGETIFIKEGDLELKTAVNQGIQEFCGQHQHNDWIEYKLTIKAAPASQAGEGNTTGVITISKAEYLALKGKLPKKAEEPEGRRFRGEED